MAKCGNIALDIETYYAGQNQPTHPNVIAFQEPWHGYRYYMAYTPYPYANGSEENPCIAVSNDLICWKKPDGAVIPIATCEELGCDELKDSHLLYREDLDRLEMWYLGRINGTLAEGVPLRCFRKVSVDGRIWSDCEIMYTFEEFNLVSPSVMYHGEYLFWGIRHTKEDTGLYFMHSADGLHWSILEKCDVPDAAETDMWHGSLTCAEGKYHMVWVGFSGKPRNRIYYAGSADGLRFDPPRIIIENDTGWDFLYRPCLLYENNIWYCYYGVVRCDGKWMISMSNGPSLNCIGGITGAELGTTSQPMEALIASSLKLKMKRRMKDLASVFTPKLMVVTPLLVVLRLLQVSPLMAWFLSVLCCAVCSAVVVERKRLICRSVIMGTVNACVAAFVAEILAQIQQLCLSLFAV